MATEIGRSAADAASGCQPTASAADASSQSGIPNALLCRCGAEISRWQQRCNDCRVKALIEAAKVVEPSTPLNLVDSDTFYFDLADAADLAGGSYAHPCDEEPLKVARPKRVAAELVERVVEEMCEEAFEDAADYVKGEPELIAAFEAALEIFNSAQTASTWTPRTGEIFVIPTPRVSA